MTDQDNQINVHGGTQGPAKRRTTYRHRLTALALLVVVGLLLFLQMHPAKTSASQTAYLQSVTLNPTRQNSGTLTFAIPRKAESYSVELILPNNASPLDYGIAYHEVREHLSVVVRQKKYAEPLVAAPNDQIGSQLSDELDSHAGVKLCEFRPQSLEPAIIECHLTDDLPWPDNVRIAVSQTSGDSSKPAPFHLNKAAQPFSFGFSAVLACLSVALFWRPTTS